MHIVNLVGQVIYKNSITVYSERVEHVKIYIGCAVML